jgi:hypothetical protein
MPTCPKKEARKTVRYTGAAGYEASQAFLTMSCQQSRSLTILELAYGVDISIRSQYTARPIPRSRCHLS